MILALVVAMAENRVIGAGQRLPWHLPADLRHFKAVTLGKTVIMGRRTYASIGRPLPGRRNIVVSRDPSRLAPGCIVAGSLEDALTAAQGEEVMVIGGAQLYREALPRAQRIHLTLVHAMVEGDTWFPDLAPGAWRETGREEHPADPHNPHPMTFLVLERTGAASDVT
ncbi:MAG: type 3 dihydrofolate reductase [Gammaproteobacteria bacterium]